MLSNGQIADEGTALKETLLAVKDVIDAHPDAGIACAFKNTGKGVGVKDVGRVKLKVENGGVIICTSAACMGQGIATVLLQIVAEATGLDKSAHHGSRARHHGHARQRHQHSIAANTRYRRGRAQSRECAQAGT